jgi:MFS family permease
LTSAVLFCNTEQHGFIGHASRTLAGDEIMPNFGPADDPALIRRIAWRVMPFMVLTYFLAIIDKSNVGFAKLQMVHALSMTEAAYGLASSLFFIGYLIFEVPSSLALHYFGARLWLGRIMVTWGIGTVLLGLTSSGGMFSGLRFLLGIAEAGAYPGLIYAISLWFPRGYRLRMVGLLTLGSALGNMFGSLAGGALLGMSGVLGFAGWQWVFFLTGIPAILLGAVLIACLPDSPKTARFLTDADRARLEAAMDRDPAVGPAHANLLNMLVNARVLALSGLYTLLLISLYGVIYWLPTVVRGFGVTVAENGVLSAIPWAVTAILLVVVPPRLPQTHLMRCAGVIATIGVLSFVASTVLPADWMRLVALSVGTPCISLLLPCFWSLPYRSFNGVQAAAAIGAISTIGTLGGFIAQNAMPWIAEITGTAAGAMLVPALCLGATGVIAFMMSPTRHPATEAMRRA